MDDIERQVALLERLRPEDRPEAARRVHRLIRDDIDRIDKQLPRSEERYRAAAGSSGDGDGKTPPAIDPEAARAVRFYRWSIPILAVISVAAGMLGVWQSIDFEALGLTRPSLPPVEAPADPEDPEEETWLEQLPDRIRKLF